MNGEFLYVATAGLGVGVALGLLGAVSMSVAVLFLCVALCFGVWFRAQPNVVVCAAMIAAVSLGAARANQVLVAESRETVSQYLGTTVRVAGAVTEDPDVRATGTRVVVSVARVEDAPASGTVLVVLPRTTRVAYGDHVTVKGSLDTPKTFETQTGHTFDYPGYLRAQGIGAIMNRASLAGSAPGSWSLVGSLYALKHAFESSVERLLPEPDSSLLEGILLGEKHGISQQLTQAFVASGLVHVLVLSGYNIAIVAEAVFRALSFLPRTAGFGLGGVLMVLFALMTGAGAATMRALLMGIIALVARYFHRSAVALRALALTAAGMALWSPESLLHDTSFILSVGATFGLITLSPWLESHMKNFRLFKNDRFADTRSIIASTLAVEIFLLPMLLYFSGVLSLLSLPANALALPVIPAAMLLGFIAGLVGFFSSTLAFLPALGADMLLKWMLLVVTTASSLPFSTITVSEFSPWFLLVIYIPLTWFAVGRYTNTMVEK